MAVVNSTPTNNLPKYSYSPKSSASQKSVSSPSKKGNPFAVLEQEIDVLDEEATVEDSKSDLPSPIQPAKQNSNVLQKKDDNSSGGWLRGIFGNELGSVTNEDDSDDDSYSDEIVENTKVSGKAIEELSKEGAVEAKESVVPPSWLSSITSRVQQITDSPVENEQMNGKDKLVEMFCSWCFATKSSHKMVRSEWLVRPHFQCEECGRLTITCFVCSEGMARCYGEEGSDKMCYRCTGLFDRVGGDASKLVCHGQKCSWCRATASQSLFRTASQKDGRDVYICAGCNARTLVCEKCPNFSRCTETWRDKLCVVCDGTFKDWEGALTTWVGQSGWCSWCISQSKHELTQKSLLFGKTYRCLNCQNPTVECKKCKGAAMARSTDKQCVSCTRNRDWEALQTEKQVAFKAENWSASKGIEEMTRLSNEKKLAWGIGHIRPFLLLVSMRPALRSQVASCLGVPLLGSEEFGDAHKEAWAIISSTNGLVSHCPQGLQE